MRIEQLGLSVIRSWKRRQLRDLAPINKRAMNLHYRINIQANMMST
jgi:hypothetical protein